MDIRNDNELKRAIKSTLPSVLKAISEQVVIIMRKNIANNSSISTTTLQKSVSYTLNANGTESTIEIDYELAQSFAEEPTLLPNGRVAWGHFTNTFDGSGGSFGEQTWFGELISFRMAEWLENGGNGYVGNQPIRANHWFMKTVLEVERTLPSLVKLNFQKMGFIIQ